MALVDPQLLELHLDLTPGSEPALVQYLLDAAQAGVESYCDRRFEQREYVEYLDGNGAAHLLLQNYPVLNDPDALEVRQDASGYYGQAAGRFAADSVLELGAAYALVVDGDDGAGGRGSACGILIRCGLAGPLADAFQRATIAGGFSPPVWPEGRGNIKATYTAGYAAGYVPHDLAAAVCQMAAVVYRTRLTGGARYSAETLGKYSYSLLAGASAGSQGADGEVGTVRQMLAPYQRRAQRELSSR